MSECCDIAAGDHDHQASPPSRHVLARATGRARSSFGRRCDRNGVAAFVAGVALLSACSGGSTVPSVPPLADDVITVGSFDFAESAVVAEVYSEGLEAAGYKVHRAFRLGPREFVGPALSVGLVELVPEYAGTAAEFYSLGRAVPTGDVAHAHGTLEQSLSGDHVVALAAAPAQDANTFVVTAQTATRLRLEKLSDLPPVADHLTFGGPPECPARPLCLAGLADTYGVRFGAVVPLDAGGPMTREALRSGLVDVALMFTTDPAIANEGLVELGDDRGLQPAESITPLVRTEILDRWGAKLAAVVDGVSARLTTAAVRDLNGAAAAAGADVAVVASAWWSAVSS
jgi:osmoprotectant transport system substrate-binding protein